MNDKMHAYLSIGFWLSKFRDIDIYSYSHFEYGRYETCDSQLCPFRGEVDRSSHHHFSFTDMFNEREIYGGVFHLSSIKCPIL